MTFKKNHCKSSLYILLTRPLLDILFCKYSLPVSLWPVFTLSDPSFEEQELLIFMKSGLSIFSSFLKIYLLIYLFLAVLGLCCCAQAFSSCSERGLLFDAVHGLLIAVPSLVAEHGF